VTFFFKKKFFLNASKKKAMSKVYFLSGPLDLSLELFQQHYITPINQAIQDGSTFVLGDACGSDTMCNKYLANVAKCKPELNLYEKIVVYHMFETPRNNPGGFKTIGGFKNDEERDAKMTACSHFDILWIRSAEESKLLYGKKFNPNKISGTKKNLLRRT
jgi:hypothetical protein